MWKPFQTTIWSSIRLARDGKSTAVSDFVGKYREPVLAFVRRQGFADEDAEDLAQEVFLLILKDHLLARAEQARGRFRSFLLGVTRNVVRNAHRVRSASKRGGGDAPVSLDAPVGDSATIADFVESGAPDETFDRDWIRRLIALALEALSRSLPRAHRVLQLHVEGLPYESIARELGLDAKQVDNQIRQARARLCELVRGEIAAYCGTREEYDDEVACLRRYLAPARPRAETV